MSKGKQLQHSAGSADNAHYKQAKKTPHLAGFFLTRQKTASYFFSWQQTALTQPSQTTKLLQAVE